MSNLNRIKDSINLSIDLIYNLHINDHYYDSEIVGKLQIISIECDKALGILKNKLTVPLTETQKNKLSSLRDQVNTLDLDSYFEKNIKLAVEHFEKGDFLACSLISSRIIVYCMTKIPLKQTQSDNKKNKNQKMRKE